MTMQASAPATSTPSRARASKAPMLIASFGAFLAFLDATIVNVCFPAIAETFPDSSTGTLSWILNAYNLVFAAVLVAGGRLADLVGRRRVFVIGVVLFTVASVLCAVAGSVEALIAWRVVQAIGAALLVPASLGVVIQAAGPEGRTHAVGLWGASAALAAGLGPPIGGALIELSGWRLAFLVNLPLGIIAVVAAMKLLDESRSPGRRRLPDLAGSAMLAGSLALISLAIVQGPEWGWGSVRVVGAAIIGVGLLVVVGLRVRTHPVPVVDRELLRIRTFALGSLGTLLAGIGMYAYLLNHILWLNLVWGYSLLQSGLAVAPGAFVTAVVAATLGKVAERHGFRPVIVVGALVWGAGLWWYANQVTLTPDYLRDWLPGAVITGIGCGAVLPLLGSVAASAVPGGRYATASSVVSAIRQLGGVLGISLLVAIIGVPPTPVEAVARLRNGWELSMWCFLVIAGVALALRPTRHPVDEAAPPLPPPDLRQNKSNAVVRNQPEERSVLRGLHPDVIAELNGRGTKIDLQAGRDLFREGEPGDCLHVLLSGRLLVRQHDAVVADLGRGSVVGELAVLSGSARSATVTAARDSTLLQIAADDMREVLTGHPAAYASVAEVLADHVRQSPAGAVAPAVPAVIAVVSVTGPEPRAVAAELIELIEEHLRVIDPGVVTAEGLERAEQAVDRVVLVAGSDDDEWRNFCLRHADRVVLVGEGSPRLPVPAENCELVLTGPVDDEQVHAWLVATGARRAHLVDRPGSMGLRPLAARLAGRSVGLALAGGGARAMSHVGLLYELEGAGIEVHRVAGVSVGAYIGAAYAAGWSVAHVEELLRAEFVQRKPVSDWTFPRYALSRGARIRQGAERVFGDLTAETLPRELTVVATDIYRREAVPLRSGLLREITCASAAIPGLLPPVRVGDRMLVDGAVTGNLPVPHLVAEGVGPVIAANLGVGGAGPRDHVVPRTPALGETLMRALLFSSGDHDLRATQQADIVVTAQTRDIGLLEFHQMDAAIEAGRAAGRAVVEALAQPSS
ncbi:MAG: DHA2 family efflux MFS transporter permease subunit [Nocardioides sp.]